jgi:hydroxyethylthiazole kinase-like uncharacterized protein yjeF
MRYVSVKEMKEIELTAINGGAVTAAELMENAGRAVADEVRKMDAGGPVTIFCGYGNNGGDGFVAARHLIKPGYDVRVFLVGHPRVASLEARTNHDRILAKRCSPELIVEPDDVGRAVRSMTQSIVVVDAIFGVGFKGQLDGVYIPLIGMMNGSGKPVVAVDVPSGLDADTGKPLPVAVKASKTVTMGYPKVGFQAPEAKEYIGELVVADIGL